MLLKKSRTFSAKSIECVGRAFTCLCVLVIYITTIVFYNVVYSKLILLSFNIISVANDQPRGLVVRVSDY